MGMMTMNVSTTIFASDDDEESEVDTAKDNGHSVRG